MTRTAISSPRVVSLAGNVAPVRPAMISPLRVHSYIVVIGSPSVSKATGTAARSTVVSGCGGVNVRLNVGAGLRMTVSLFAVVEKSRRTQSPSR